jgi:hypothetical protein
MLVQIPRTLYLRMCSMQILLDHGFALIAQRHRLSILHCSISSMMPPGGRPSHAGSGGLLALAVLCRPPLDDDNARMPDMAIVYFPRSEKSIDVISNSSEEFYTGER